VNKLIIIQVTNWLQHFKVKRSKVQIIRPHTKCAITDHTVPKLDKYYTTTYHTLRT